MRAFGDLAPPGTCLPTSGCPGDLPSLVPCIPVAQSKLELILRPTLPPLEKFTVAIWFIWVHVNFILTPKICGWGFTIHKCLHSSHQRLHNVSWTEVLVFNSVFLAVSGNSTSLIGWGSCHVHESLLTYFSLVHTPHGGFILFEWKFHFFHCFLCYSVCSSSFNHTPLIEETL